MTETDKSKVLHDLLASASKLESNLVGAMEVGGEHAPEVEPILARVREMISGVKNRVIALADDEESSGPEG